MLPPDLTLLPIAGAVKYLVAAHRDSNKMDMEDIQFEVDADASHQ